MIEERLCAIEERAQATTPGPWRLETPEEGGRILARDDRATVIFLPPCCPHNPDAIADSEFVVHARQDVPDLLAEARRLRAENAALAAWECEECHARFPNTSDPRMLEGVRLCSRCVEVEQLGIIIDGATALRFPVGNGIYWWAEERDGVWVSYSRDAIEIERDHEAHPSKACAIYSAQVNAAKERKDA